MLTIAKRPWRRYDKRAILKSKGPCVARPCDAVIEHVRIGEEDDVKMLKVVAEPVVVVAQPADTLTQMQIELQPLARKVRTAAAVLLIFSLLRMCSPAGFFGLIAASSVLCCAAPGSLGTAYASRCALPSPHCPLIHSSSAMKLRPVATMPHMKA